LEEGLEEEEAAAESRKLYLVAVLETHTLASIGHHGSPHRKVDLFLLEVD